MNTERKKKAWSEKEEKILIDIWKNKIDDLRKAKRNMHIYSSMALEFKNFYNIDITPKEIQRKINNLSQKYRNEKKVVGTTGGSPSEWHLYSEVHSIIGHFACNDAGRMNETISVDDILNISCSSEFSEPSPLSSPPLPSPLLPPSPIPPSPVPSTSAASASADTPDEDCCTSSGKKRKKLISEKILEEIQNTNKLLKKDMEDMKEYYKEGMALEKEWLNVMKNLVEKM